MGWDRMGWDEYIYVFELGWEGCDVGVMWVCCVFSPMLVMRIDTILLVQYLLELMMMNSTFRDWKLN